MFANGRCPSQNNYLSLRQHEVSCNFKPLWSRKIFVHSKLIFQLQQLLTRESGARSSCLSNDGSWSVSFFRVKLRKFENVRKEETQAAVNDIDIRVLTQRI